MQSETPWTNNIYIVPIRGTSDGDDRGGGGRDKNQNPKKSLGFPTKPKKIPCRISELKNFQKLNAYSFFMIPYEDIISGHYHESWDCFEYPEKNPT